MCLRSQYPTFLRSAAPDLVFVRLLIVLPSTLLFADKMDNSLESCDSFFFFSSLAT
jgi:hypothetical protein